LFHLLETMKFAKSQVVFLIFSFVAERASSFSYQPGLEDGSRRQRGKVLSELRSLDPGPRQATDTYKLPSGWKKTENVWSDDQCPQLDNDNPLIQNTNLKKCIEECTKTDGCTAIDHSKYHGNGQCILRMCGTSAPTPEIHSQRGRKGYHLNADTCPDNFFEVIITGDAKETYSNRIGLYLKKKGPVLDAAKSLTNMTKHLNQHPVWLNEKNAIWFSKEDGGWLITDRADIGIRRFGIFAPANKEGDCPTDISQWQWYETKKGHEGWISEGQDIKVAGQAARQKQCDSDCHAIQLHTRKREICQKLCLRRSTLAIKLPTEHECRGLCPFEDEKKDVCINLCKLGLDHTELEDIWESEQAEKMKELLAKANMCIMYMDGNFGAWIWQSFNWCSRKFWEQNVPEHFPPEN